MDSNNLTPLRKGIVGVQFLFVAFGATVLVPLLVGLGPFHCLIYSRDWYSYLSRCHSWEGSYLS